MAQTVGVFPELSDSDKKDLKQQLVPSVPGVPKKKKKNKRIKKILVPGLQAPTPEESLGAAVANSSQFSSVEPMEGGTVERREAARRKRGY